MLRNDAELGLYNGDLGVLDRAPDGGGLQAFFRLGGGASESGFALASLPEHELRWTATVHKSQGAEYDAVAVSLPDEPESPLLTRELLYTAVTRARRGSPRPRHCRGAAGRDRPPDPPRLGPARPPLGLNGRERVRRPRAYPRPLRRCGDRAFFVPASVRLNGNSDSGWFQITPRAASALISSRSSTRWAVSSTGPLRFMPPPAPPRMRP